MDIAQKRYHAERILATVPHEHLKDKTVLTIAQIHLAIHLGVDPKSEDVNDIMCMVENRAHGHSAIEAA